MLLPRTREAVRHAFDSLPGSSAQQLFELRETTWNALGGSKVLLSPFDPEASQSRLLVATA
jgi:hypothetical protein